MVPSPRTPLSPLPPSDFESDFMLKRGSEDRLVERVMSDNDDFTRETTAVTLEECGRVEIQAQLSQILSRIEDLSTEVRSCNDGITSLRKAWKNAEAGKMLARKLAIALAPPPPPDSRRAIFQSARSAEALPPEVALMNSSVLGSDLDGGSMGALPSSSSAKASPTPNNSSPLQSPCKVARIASKYEEEGKSGRNSRKSSRDMGSEALRSFESSNRMERVVEGKVAEGKRPSRLKSSLQVEIEPHTVEHLGMHGILEKHRRRGQMAKTLWDLMEDRESSVAAKWYARGMPIFLATTVAITMLESADSFDPTAGFMMQTLIEVFFGIEVLIRLCVCPNMCQLLTNPHTMIDIMAVAPLLLRMNLWSGFNTEEHWVALRWGAETVIRLLKTLRYFENLPLLLNALAVAAEALPVLLFTLALITLLFSTIFYFLEDRSTIPSFPVSVWFTLVTMTVGYGDVVPQTAGGKVVTGVLVIISLLYLALPVTFVGQAFNDVWRKRDQIVLKRFARKCLLEWGYAPHTLPKFFQYFDEDGNAELDMGEFIEMFRTMHIGLSDSQIERLFYSFDADGSGMINEREFVKGLFPSSYHEIYTEDDGESNVRREKTNASLFTLLGLGSVVSCPSYVHESASLRTEMAKQESSELAQL